MAHGHLSVQHAAYTPVVNGKSELRDATKLFARSKKRRWKPQLSADFVALDSSMQRVVGDAAARRHADRVLVPLFANAAFLPFLKNLLCSMRRLDVHNWIVVAMDNVTCPALQLSGFFSAVESHACVEPYTERPLVTSDRARYGSTEFWRLVVQRPLWIRWLLTQGFSVLQCDVDVVWLRNPLHLFASTTELAPVKRCSHPASIFGPTNKSGVIKWQQRKDKFSCHMHNSTLMVQSEMAYGYNCGFYFARPDNSSVWFMDAWMQEMLQPAFQRVMHEQHAMLFTLGHLFSRSSHKWLSRGMQLIKLDEVRFPNGKVWYDQWNHPLYATDKRKAFILHCNWVKRSEQKKLRLKRDNLWFLDDRDEKCQAGFDPFAESCQRRCVPVGRCGAMGTPCEEWGCRGFTQRALTDLAISARSNCDGTPMEDRWHPMAWRRACGPKASTMATLSEGLLPASSAAALDHASALLQSGAPIAAVFAIPNLTDVTGRHAFRDLLHKYRVP